MSLPGIHYLPLLPALILHMNVYIAARHAYATLFSQKLLNRTQHPIAILRHTEIQLLVFTGERLSQYHINIYWYCSMLILTLCSLILWNSVFISVCHRASEMQFYSMFFEHFYRKEHPIYCFMS